MLRALRYTRIALILFGLGLVLGFVLVVIGGHPWLERVASATMALALVALPAALFADGRALAILAWTSARFPRGKRKTTRVKSRAATRRRPPAARAPGRRRS